MAQARYKCIRKCYFRHRVYLPGEIEVFDKESGEYIPRHFELVGEPLMKPEKETFKPVIKGLRAPIDRDQAEKIEAKRRAATSPVDAHKSEEHKAKK